MSKAKSHTNQDIIILASSSPARRNLLARLAISFDSVNPNIDETYADDEPIEKIVERLAIEKAEKVATDYPAHLIIACDQLLSCQGQILGKPYTLQSAQQQLQLMSGNVVHSYTGLVLLNSRTKQRQVSVERYEVTIRELNSQQIARYLAIDQPFQCAGSIKAESLGIALIDSFTGRDPNALTGLPLIKLVDMLAKEGISLPK